MPKLTLVIGTVATGKSYYIEKILRPSPQVDVLDIYDYQERVYHEHGVGDKSPIHEQFRCLMDANNLLLDDILKRLAAGCDVVAEQTFYKAKRRITYIDAIRKIPDATIEVYVMSPSESLWRSNLKEREMEDCFQRIQRERAAIEFPNVSEGFDAIYEVIDGEARLRMDTPRPEILETARAELVEEAEKILLEDKRSDLIKSMRERKFWHYCEVCGKKEFITAREAFDSGWDYPPDMGRFWMLGPRTCGKCLMKDTLWFKVLTGGKLPIVCEGDLMPQEMATWQRIKGEPESLLS